MARGSVRRDASGRWFFVTDVPVAGGSRRQVRRRGFSTRREAQQALDALRGQVAQGTYVRPANLTVGEYLVGQWLPTIAARVRPTTADTYRRLVVLHVVPMLGAVPLQKLDRATVSQWVGRLSSSGLSAKSVRNIHGILAKALADALENELVSRNVASKVKGLPRLDRPPPKAWTAEQLVRFLSATADDRLAPLWRFLAVTGCRRGEALGLRWVDLDLAAGTATITNQRAIAGGSVVEGAPKTRAGARTVSLDTTTVAALRAWKRRQAEERLVMGAGWGDTGLVFTHADGNGLWPQTVTRRFRETSAALGLPLIGVHGLRHSAATWMIASGVNPRVVQQRLGHAHVSVTLGLYTHVMPAHDKAAADALGEALDGRP